MVDDGLGIDTTRFREDAKTRTARDVSIGNDVWIGGDVTIMNGVQVSNGRVIGTKALVTEDCEPYGVYGGVSARLIRYRFSEEVLSELEQIAWWDWDQQRIARNAAFFDTDPMTQTGVLKCLVRP